MGATSCATMVDVENAEEKHLAPTSLSSHLRMLEEGSALAPVAESVMTHRRSIEAEVSRRSISSISVFNTSRKS